MNFYSFSIALEFANGIELVTETASFHVIPFADRFIYYVELLSATPLSVKLKIGKTESTLLSSRSTYDDIHVYRNIVVQ